jgi:predicted  nucleic acid-binding Zn-ribbon protein
LDSKRVKIIKKPRDSQAIETEIAEVEQRIKDLSDQLATPEVARDITKLVEANDQYQQAEARLAELMDEWERAETTAGGSNKKSVRRR